MELGNPLQQQLIATLQERNYPHASHKDEVTLLVTLGSYMRDDLANLRRIRQVPEQHEEPTIAYKEILAGYKENWLIVQQVARGLDASLDLIKERVSIIDMESRLHRKKCNGEECGIEAVHLKHLKENFARRSLQISSSFAREELERQVKARQAAELEAYGT